MLRALEAIRPFAGFGPSALTRSLDPFYGTVFTSIAKFLHSTGEKSMPEQYMKKKRANYCTAR